MEEKQRAILVGINLNDDADFEISMEELASLAEACDMEVIGKVEQNLATINQAFYIGTGKVDEVREAATALEADYIIFDNALTPSQLRNLQRELVLPILDRTTLILEIFSTRAKTREAKLQVETARLQYMLPRLVGMHTSLSRQGGGSGLSNKGAGEKKLELDRRRIEHRLSELRKELETIAKDRDTQRKQRMNSNMPQVALVGYTNAGKSTMMNAMLDMFSESEDKKVEEKNMLFATLDTTVRKIEPGDNKNFLLSDTVGFIDKLPHNLIKAFRSTLEEVRNADLLLQIIDYSDVHFKEHIRVTEDTLKELGADSIPCIYVMNKADLVMPEDELPMIKENRIYMSAKKQLGIEALVGMMRDRIFLDYKECQMLIPYDKGSITSYLNEHATVSEAEYKENGVLLTLSVKHSDYQKYINYVVS
ncbi:MAG: GTPase HflX [Lachnospiraceae bacterium]|nr:GTPase HflX [Lachnospiraceae bacterium]